MAKIKQVEAFTKSFVAYKKNWVYNNNAVTSSPHDYLHVIIRATRGYVVSAIGRIVTLFCVQMKRGCLIYGLNMDSGHWPHLILKALSSCEPCPDKNHCIH